MNSLYGESLMHSRYHIEISGVNVNKRKKKIMKIMKNDWFFFILGFINMNLYKLEQKFVIFLLILFFCLICILNVYKI